MKDTIFEMYKSISVGKNQICLECNNEGALGKPLSIYFIGENFKTSDDTILFVGKTAIGGEGIGPFIDNLFTDGTEFGELSLDLKEEYATRRAFYSYTHDIVAQYYGSYENGKKHIALTNLVKCNNASTNDETPPSVKQCCINDLQVIWKEIEILQPKRIVFYTGRNYDDYIDNFEPLNYFECIDIVDDDPGCWWHRKFLDNNKNTICDFLRVFHPSRQGKEEFVSNVVDWLNETKTK